jgi:hypothetical protein
MEAGPALMIFWHRFFTVGGSPNVAINDAKRKLEFLSFSVGKNSDQPLYLNYRVAS